MIKFFKGLFGIGTTAATGSLTGYLWAGGAVVAILLAGAIFVSGWTVRGWKDDRDSLKVANAGFAKAIGDQSTKMDDLLAISRASVGATKRLVAATKEGQDAIREYAAKGGTCLLTDADAAVLRDAAAKREAAHTDR